MKLAMKTNTVIPSESSFLAMGPFCIQLRRDPNGTILFETNNHSKILKCIDPLTINHLLISRKVKVTQLCPTLCDLMDYTAHGILQARILE